MAAIEVGVTGSEVAVAESQIVMVDEQPVGVVWSARGGGYTLRTGPSLARAKIHHFSANEGRPGLIAYIEKRFGAPPRFIPLPGADQIAVEEAADP